MEGGDNIEGTGYYKGGRDSLHCKNDDTKASAVRSSYGDRSVNLAAGPTNDMGRYAWNYWGYRNTNATCSETNVSGCAGTAFSTPDDAFTAAADTSLLADPASTYDVRNNPLKYSLSNRFAPNSTIITHCVFHRVPTSNMDNPFDTSDAEKFASARDIILRLDGSARSLNIAQFQAKSYWAKPTF